MVSTNPSPSGAEISTLPALPPTLSVPPVGEKPEVLMLTTLMLEPEDRELIVTLPPLPPAPVPLPLPPCLLHFQRLEPTPPQLCSLRPAPVLPHLPPPFARIV